jgi:hypothetical protein
MVVFNFLIFKLIIYFFITVSVGLVGQKKLQSGPQVADP